MRSKSPHSSDPSFGALTGALPPALAAALSAVGEDASPVDTEAIRALVAALGGFSPPGWDSRLASAIQRALEANLSGDVNLARVAGELLRHRYGSGDPLALARVGEAVCRDPLCVALLANALNVDAGLELAVTSMRRALLSRHAGLGRVGSLLRAARGSDLRGERRDWERALVIAIAIQGYENDYVLYEDEAETAAVAQLEQAVADAGEEATHLTERRALDLMVLGMYRPLHDLAVADALEKRRGPSGPADALLRRVLPDPLGARRCQEEIEVVGAIADPTSIAVRTQYEANPYPRWRIDPATPPASLPAFLAAYAEAPTPGGDRWQVLIAGSGTGQQAISSAQKFPEAVVTAIDVSIASLGYGRYMAERLGVSNIRFVHADVLNASLLDTRFDLIESVGVLHHLEDPAAGLTALGRVLSPNGLIRLGLYSELARAPVVAGHARIAALQLEPTARDMRAYRRRIISSEEPEAVWELMRYHDFYNLSEFRDMLFHVREHRFTLPALEEVLRDTGFRCLGMEPPDEGIARRYRRRFKKDRSMRNLANWAQLEHQHPESFRRMYVLWCQRTGRRAG